MMIPRVSRRQTPQSLAPEDIRDAIQDVDSTLVVFDVEDVLVIRCLMERDDLFRLLELDYSSYFNRQAHLARSRRLAQRRVSRRLGRPATLEEIYDDIDWLTDNQRAWAMRHEVELLYGLSEARNGMLRVWDWCKRCDYPVMVRYSGCYDSRVVLSVLTQCGYEEVTLLVGDGWQKELAHQNSKGGRVLYVSSSLTRALTVRDDSVSCFLLDALPKTPYFNRKMHRWSDIRSQVEYSIIQGFVANNMPCCFGYFEALGYEAIGPILLGFARWLLINLADKDIRKIFFLTREGALLKRAFEAAFGHYDGPPFELLSVSRVATTVPLLDECESWDDLIRTLRIPKSGATIKNVLEKIGIDFREATLALSSAGISPDEFCTSLSVEQKAVIFKSVHESLVDRAKNQRCVLESYLDEHDVRGKVALVDIGWFGSIQANLQHMRPNDKICGCYVAWKPNVDGDKRLPRTDFYLYDSIYSEVGEKVASALEVFELCFLSTEGSVRGYEKGVDGHIIPILDIPEQDMASAELIQGLQDAALRFVTDFAPRARALGLLLPPDACSAAYCSFVDPPSEEMVRQFGQFKISDVGLSPRSPFTEGSILRYIMHPKEFIADLHGPGSKSVLLKSTFRVSLPWAKVLSVLRKIDGREG